MADVFSNSLRVREQESGSNAGTWGGLLNTTIRNIASAFGQGSETIPNASTHTITLADGVADEARSLYLRCTGGGQACTVTLAPNTISKVWIIDNATSYTLTFSQGSGANVAIAAGAVKVIATDGAGSGAAVTDALSGLDASLSGLTVDTTTLVVDATNNNVGIGVASPSAILDVRRGDASGKIAEFHTSTGFGIEFGSSQSEAYIEAGSNQALLFNTNGSNTRMRITSAGALQLSDVNSPNDINTAIYSNSDVLEFEAFGTNGAIAFSTGSGVDERMRISGGNLLVGQTAPSGSAIGMYFRPGQESGINSDGDSALQLNRLTNDGAVLRFYQGGTNVGSIDSRIGLGITINSSSGADGILSNGGSYSYGWNAAYFYPRVDATSDLGFSGGLRFKDLYLSGGAYLGGTAAANKLDDYEEGTWTMGLSTLGGGFSATITNTTGTYTKVGNIVNVRIYTGAVNVSAAGSGTALITGLPFTVASSGGFNSNYSAASFAHTSIFSTTYEAYGAINQTYAVVVQVGANPPANAAFASGNGLYMMFTLTYKTDA